MISYELAKQLKDAGYGCQESDIHRCSFGHCNNCGMCDLDDLTLPTLSELIEACGNRIWRLEFDATQKRWQVFSQNTRILLQNLFGSTPEEAVANLWLKLNAKA